MPSTSLSTSPIETCGTPSHGGVPFALNLCDAVGSETLASPAGAGPDAVLDALARAAAAQAGVTGFERLYVGSYFCERLFLSLDDAFFAAASRFARGSGMGLTLVLPVFGQATLAAGTARTEALLAPDDAGRCAFDEVVANDPATAERLGALLAAAYPFREPAPGRPAARPARPLLVRGRLMARAARDPRYPELAASPRPCPLDARQAQLERARLGFSLAELDPFAPVIDLACLEGALPVALHLPHCAMSTGRICEAASTSLPDAQRFRAGRPCARQCLAGVDVYEAFGELNEPVYLTRQGRTVYFENPGCRVVGGLPARVVWSPADYACPYGEDLADGEPHEGGTAIADDGPARRAAAWREEDPWV